MGPSQDWNPGFLILVSALNKPECQASYLEQEGTAMPDSTSLPKKDRSSDNS